MASFAGLLTSYMARTGVGDAEFARRLGVSRLTLIRWKEGVTQRPRYREDVLRCAELLRLEAGERDGLLLAAGFAPDAPPQSPEPVAEPQPREAAEDDAHPEMEGVDDARSGLPQPVRPGSRKTLGIAVAVALALAFTLIAGVAGVAMVDDPDHPIAEGGESLSLMAPFTNYTAGQQGFNVRGRLKREITGRFRSRGFPVCARPTGLPESPASRMRLMRAAGLGRRWLSGVSTTADGS